METLSVKVGLSGFLNVYIGSSLIKCIKILYSQVQTHGTGQYGFRFYPSLLTSPLHYHIDGKDTVSL